MLYMYYIFKNFEPTNNFLSTLIENIENSAFLKITQNELKNVEHFIMYWIMIPIKTIFCKFQVLPISTSTCVSTLVGTSYTMVICFLITIKNIFI